jgi:hypothetical protein
MTEPSEVEIEAAAQALRAAWAPYLTKWESLSTRVKNRYRTEARAALQAAAMAREAK